MSEGWIETSERLLEQIRKASAKEDKDRLELVQSLRFALYALHRSLLGWMNWVNSPDVMTAFKKEELDEMNKRITEFIEDFIKYDIEVTQRGAKKKLGPKKPRHKEAKKRGLGEIFYV